MYSALKQSVPQKPNNWLTVRTFKKPKANKLATGPQSVKIHVSVFGAENGGVVPYVDTVLRHSLMMRSMYLCFVQRMAVWCPKLLLCSATP
jgi:hypothetical protein